jgi:hypothetical protein
MRSGRRAIAVRFNDMVRRRNEHPSREKRTRVRDLLMREWDPLGVSGIPGAANEYDNYVGKVYLMLMDRQADDKEVEERIAAYLFNIATNEIGLSAYETLAERSVGAAAALIALRPEFDTH